MTVTGTESSTAELIDSINRIDLHEPGANARRRRNQRRRVHLLARNLPPGALDEAWEADLLTAGQYETAAKHRARMGLDP